MRGLGEPGSTVEVPNPSIACFDPSSPMDGVAALEGQHVGVFGEGRADLGRRRAREDALGKLQPLHLAPEVEFAPLHSDHLTGIGEGSREGGGRRRGTRGGRAG